MTNVTRLPPGEAIGARDLQNWSHQRAVGRSGVYVRRKEREEPKRDAANEWLARHDPKRRAQGGR